MSVMCTTAGDTWYPVVEPVISKFSAPSTDVSSPTNNRMVFTALRIPAGIVNVDVSLLGEPYTVVCTMVQGETRSQFAGSRFRSACTA